MNSSIEFAEVNPQKKERFPYTVYCFVDIIYHFDPESADSKQSPAFSRLLLSTRGFLLTFARDPFSAIWEQALGRPCTVGSMGKYEYVMWLEISFYHTISCVEPSYAKQISE